MDSPSPETDSKARLAAKLAWAKLIYKVYEVDPLVYPKCGAEMRVIALIEDPALIGQVRKQGGLRAPLQDGRAGLPLAQLPRLGGRADLLRSCHLNNRATFSSPAIRLTHSVTTSINASARR